MKLHIEVKMEYPPTPPDEKRSYEMRNQCDVYTQTLEIEEEEIKGRLFAIIQAFNNFKLQ